MKHRNLASERERLCLNQEECAEQLGVSMYLLGKYEADCDSMPGEFIKKAAEFFHCSAAYLLDMTDERNATN